MPHRWTGLAQFRLLLAGKFEAERRSPRFPIVGDEPQPGASQDAFAEIIVRAAAAHHAVHFREGGPIRQRIRLLMRLLVDSEILSTTVTRDGGGRLAEAKTEALERPSFDGYKEWLAKTFKVNLTTEANRYERESLRVKVAAEESEFWTSFQAAKTELADKYYASTSYRLFADDGRENMLVKPWKSFLEKTYRANVLGNELWPEPPDGGWYLPINWYERFHDIARTSVVVKYLDGVTFITDYFQEIQKDLSLAEYDCEFEARDTGYYAAHSRVGIGFNLLVENWTEVEKRGSFEVQVTTQLQEVIRRLTHTQYEARRMNSGTPEMKWQWDYTSDAFKPNYLGHILHYLEGMIMEVRDKGK